MTRAELVTDFWHARLPLNHLDLERLFRRRAENHAVDIGWILLFVPLWSLTPVTDNFLRAGAFEQLDFVVLVEVG